MIKVIDFIARLPIENVFKKSGSEPNFNGYRFDERLLLENKFWKWYL